MGIGTETFGFIHKSLYAVMPDLRFVGKYMVELGDQKFNASVALKSSGERVWAKDYFEQLGFHHYSIDWHGKNGAFPLDLSKPIEDGFWLGKFDVLTNLGTSEHVLDQHQCWRNIHELVRVGGCFIHVLPQAGKLKEHCPHHYDIEFFKKLALTNGYKIIFAEYLSTISHCAACLIKQENSLFDWGEMDGNH